MSAAATETSCFGETSRKSTSVRSTVMKSPPARAMTRSSTRLPLASMRALAWAMTYFSSSQAVR
jgi:hypothetical protein